MNQAVASYDPYSNKRRGMDVNHTEELKNARALLAPRIVPRPWLEGGSK